MRSLYSKFVIFTMMTMIGSAIIAFLAVNTYYHQFLKSDNDAKNMGVLQEITAYIEANPELDLEQFLRTQANVGYKLYLVNNNTDYTAQMFGDPFRSFNLDLNDINDVLNGIDYHGMRDLPKETFVTGFFADELANSVGTSFTIQDQNYALFLRPNIKMLFSEVHFLLGGLLIGMGIVSLVAIILVVRQLIKPLRQLTTATETIRTGNFNVPLIYDSNDEIGQLAQSFTQMTNELAKADQMQKQFITDVSHDLQTPLQQIKGYATLIREGNISDEERTDYLHIIERETDRLSNLSRQLLLLTSLDANRQYEKMTSFRLDEQIKEAIIRFRWQLEKKNLTLTAEIDETTIEGVESFIEQLWDNLLSNAIKYTAENREISLTVQDFEQHVEVTIKDEGIGIAQEHIPNLFDRFYRVDDARSSHIDGTGLGLAIVKKIVDLHKGTIHIESAVDEGTKITIKLNKSLR